MIGNNGYLGLFSLYSFCAGLLFGLAVAMTVYPNYWAMSLCLILAVVKSAMSIRVYEKIRFGDPDKGKGEQR